MNFSNGKTKCWLPLFMSTGLALSLCACKTQPKPGNAGLLGSRDLVPPPYASPVATRPAPAATTPPQSLILPADSADKEPVFPGTDAFVPAESPVFVDDNKTPEPANVLETPAEAKQPATVKPEVAQTAPTVNRRTHKIQKGDTLSGIAQCVGVKWQDIAALNPNVNPNHMIVGQTIVLPSYANDNPITVQAKSSKSGKATSSKNAVPSTKTANLPADGVYTVASGDSLWIISRRFKVSSDDIRKWNDLKTDKLMVGQKLKLKGTATIKKTEPKKAAPVKPVATAPENATPVAVTEPAPQAEPAITEPAVEAVLVTPDEIAPAEVTQIRSFDHEVAENDTLESIGGMYEVKLEDLLRSNPGIKSNADLVPGTILKITYPAK